MYTIRVMYTESKIATLACHQCFDLNELCKCAFLKTILLTTKGRVSGFFYQILVLLHEELGI